MFWHLVGNCIKNSQQVTKLGNTLLMEKAINPIIAS